MINFIPRFSWPWNKSTKSAYTNTPFWYGFSKTFNFNKIYTTKQNNDLLVKYFNEVAEFAAPILKYLDGTKQIKIEASIPEVQALIDKPNYYQTGLENFSQYILFYLVFGESVTNFISARRALSGVKPVSLFNISPQFMGIKTKQDKYRPQDKDFRTDEIVSYLFNQDRQGLSTLVIEPKDILHLKECHPNFEDTQYLFGESRAASCYMAIESIREGYGAKTNLYSNGPRTYITGKSQGEFTSINETEDIDQLQKRLKKYGWDKDSYNTFLTDKALDVTVASMNVAQLQINENNASDFDTICNAFGIDSKAFSYYKGTTFANKKEALKDFYNNSFRSVIDIAVNAREKALKRWWPDLELRVNYSQITEIVEAELEEKDRLFENVKIGLMTRNQYLEQTGQDRISLPDFDKYHVFSGNTWISLEPNDNGDETSEFLQRQLESQATIRGSVGGVQGIIGILTAVNQGTMPYSSGLATLMEIYGFNSQIASLILGPQNTNNNGQEATQQNQAEEIQAIEGQEDNQ